MKPEYKMQLLMKNFLTLETTVGSHRVISTWRRLIHFTALFGLAGHFLYIFLFFWLGVKTPSSTMRAI
jgi:hypothetical protein